MDFYRFVVCLIFPLYLLTLSKPAKAINPCGDPAVGDCLSGCYTSCKKLDMNRNGMSAEKIATLKNLCDSKCYGIIYNPSKEFGDGSLLTPGYSEVSQCLGICAYPPPLFCQEGYLSQFFYCDCHTCCLQNPTGQAACAEACHVWFMKQWSPKRGEGCRYMPSYNLTKNEWCSAFCSWQMITMQQQISPNSNVNNIISNPPAPCVRKCTSAIQNGIPVDYDTRSTCSNPLHCITINIRQFLITTTFDDTLISPHLVPVTVEGGGHENRWSNTIIDKPRIFNYTWTHVINNSIPDALINLRGMGVNVTFEPGREILKFAVRPPSDYIQQRESRLIEELLRKSYRTRMTTGWGETTIRERYPYNFTYLIPPCSVNNVKHDRHQITKIPAAYEVYITISDPKGGLPFTGINMRTLIAQTPQFAGLQMVQEIDDSTVEMKWSGNMILTFPATLFKGSSGNCERIPGCTPFVDLRGCAVHISHYYLKPYYGDSS